MGYGVEYADLAMVVRRGPVRPNRENGMLFGC
jgi:hypothetical protein